MRSTTLGLLVLSLSLGTATMAVAKNPNPDITRQELQNFDVFLDSHSAIDADLTKDPKLINNSDYIAAHPELNGFLLKHPGVREEMKETPRFFMHREEQFDKSGRDITHREVASLDVFFDAHPGIERDIHKDPSLATNTDFLAKHPEYAEFLKSHPGVKTELAKNPRAFLKQEARLDQAEKKESRETAQQERREEKRETPASVSTRTTTNTTARAAVPTVAVPRASRFKN